ncbi:MAG: twin-arginine translocase TatA/TatE family subunit [Hyphomicrobiales bacterium]|nr:twin-arginine translocase TatA/TatE family subunit [Hyphomicrobiales bacterium]MBV9053081.1 twin-arginine translocase TatA/TatE family subunit [Hyphomicrobiales bacterium]MBV9136719.1 twin-arginine translocase TatA/TatE family subunit [Hyphomicrobiales bacterium]MBV9754201.1 twin-arginine translocase TatA/TatE family subunit [Hyphomicrobiales bacterium]MBV9973851.1 twin-arginine translocase TatA/TatE family subunit [Hyphomicrobiales bacterium]
MGSLSIWHWLIVIVVVMLVFGKGRISDVMGDFAKGIKSFKKGMAEDDQAAEAAKSPPRPVEHQPSEPASVSPVARDTKTG